MGTLFFTLGIFALFLWWMELVYYGERAGTLFLFSCFFFILGVFL